MFLFQGLSEKKLMQNCSVISFQFKKIIENIQITEHLKHITENVLKSRIR